MRLIDADEIVYESIDSCSTGRHESYYGTGIVAVRKEDIDALPTIEPELIRCNDCKYWTQSIGKMKGYGLGKCDFHNVSLVTCNGFCYWAERKDNG